MGLTAVPLGEGSSSALLRALKANEIAGLVSDRDLVGNGVEVEFFGEKTTLPAGAATLALRTGAPLLPVVVYSGPGNWHTGVVHPPLDTTRQGTMREDIVRVTQDLATTFEHDIRRPSRAVAPLPAQLAERPPMRIAMLSPYALSRPGGVQGQVIGLARVAAGARATRSPCWRRRRPGDEVPDAVGEHYVIGRPDRRCARTGRWPRWRCGRRRRRGPSASCAAAASTCVHLHEPLAPMAAYGLVLTRAAPDGRHLPPGRGEPLGAPVCKPLAELVGRRMQIRVAVSEAARETGLRSGGGDFEVLFNGVDMERFESAAAASRRGGPARRAVPRPPRAAQGPAASSSTPSRRWSGPPSCGWPATVRPPRCSAAATPSRTGCTGWAC